MKVALCIHGYFSNKNNDDLTKTNKIYDYIIRSLPQCDVFIHSFDVSNKDSILSKYSKNLVTYHIEPQINFRNILTPHNIQYETTLDTNIFPSPICLFSTFSFLYSRKQSTCPQSQQPHHSFISITSTLDTHQNAIFLW